MLFLGRDVLRFQISCFRILLLGLADGWRNFLLSASNRYEILVLEAVEAIVVRLIVLTLS